LALCEFHPWPRWSSNLQGAGANSEHAIMNPKSAASIIKDTFANKFSSWPTRREDNRLEPECWPEITPRFEVQGGATVFTTGSCFARNIEAHLHNLGFNVPAYRFLLENTDLTETFGIELLNKYTPASIHDELEWTRRIMDRDDVVRMEDIESYLIPVG